MSSTIEWLTPNSPATPSALGAIIVTVSFPFAEALDISFKWVALIISLFVGALIALSIAQPIARPLRSLYWIFNSLLVFSVALGVGISVDSPPPPPPPLLTDLFKLTESTHVDPKVAFPYNFLGIDSAFAQAAARDTPPPQSTSGRRDSSSQGRSNPQLAPAERERFDQYLKQQEKCRKAQMVLVEHPAPR